MRKLCYVTGNISKFNIAQDHLKIYGVEIVRKELDIPEIQSENIEEIAIDKAKKAYKLTKHPVFVNDTGWFITVLNGFPAAYMKDVNHWFKAEDFLNLMKNHQNREVVLKQVICFADKDIVKTFVHIQKAIMLEESRGEGLPSTTVISFDGIRSIAEVNAQTGKSASDQYNLWDEFTSWVNNYFQKQ